MTQQKLRLIPLLLVLLSRGLYADDTATIEAVLDGFHRAAATADYQRYRSLMAEDIVFLGTDASERWQGQAFADFARPRFESGRGWEYRPRDRRISLSMDGKVAWFDELLSHDKLGTCRGSGVMVRESESGEWKVAQYNLSVPVPNDLVLSVVAQIRGEPSAATVAVEPAAASGAASVEEPAVQDEAQPEASEEKRCRKRHKTNRAANC